MKSAGRVILETYEANEDDIRSVLIEGNYAYVMVTPELPDDMGSAATLGSVEFRTGEDPRRLGRACIIGFWGAQQIPVWISDNAGEPA